MTEPGHSRSEGAAPFQSPTPGEQAKSTGSVPLDRECQRQASRSLRNRVAATGIVLATLSVAGIVSLGLAIQPIRERLLEQGLTETRRDPVSAERTFRGLLRTPGRHHSDAAIALCRLLVRRKAFQEAAAMFANLDLSTCRADLLLAFARDGLKTELQTESRIALETVGRGHIRESIPALELLLEDFGEWGQRARQLEVAAALTHLQPDNPRYWATRVDLLTRMALETECEAVVREAQKHDLPFELRCNFQNSLAQQLVNQGNAPAARRELAELIRLEGESVRVRGLEVYVCRLEGNLDRALEIVTPIVEENPKLQFPRFTRGIVLLDQRKFKAAAADLEDAIAAQPFDAPAHFKLSEACRGLGQDDQAAEHRRIAAEIVTRQKRISDLLRLREEDPRNPVYNELEQLYRELGDVEAARMWHRWGVRVSRY